MVTPLAGVQIARTLEEVIRFVSSAVAAANSAKPARIAASSLLVPGAAAFAAGVAVGTCGGLLLAPKTGKELRATLKGKVNDAVARIIGGSSAEAESGSGANVQSLDSELDAAASKLSAN